MKIRSATAADRSGIIGCDHLALQRLSFLDRILDTGSCVVVERDGRVIAYGALEHTFFEQGFISMVYVAESERRRGIGSALAESLAQRCKTQKLFSSTNESNLPMQRLFERLRFVQSGRIDNLDPGDPELVYFRDLRTYPARASVGAQTQESSS